MKSLKSKLFKDQPLTTASFSRTQLLFFAAIFAAIGGYILWRTFAAPPPAPSLNLHVSLDQAFPDEAIQVVWDAQNATACTGNTPDNTYHSRILQIDDGNTQGARQAWDDPGGLKDSNGQPVTSGSARTLPLFNSDFSTDNAAPQKFSLICSGPGGSIEKTVAVAKEDLAQAGQQGSFNISCKPIPDLNGADITKPLPNFGLNKNSSFGSLIDQQYDPGGLYRPNDPLSPRFMDPIVFPNKNQAEVKAAGSHMHEFFGNKNLDENTTPRMLLKALPSYPHSDTGWSETSCSQQGGSVDAQEVRNGSAYWPPTMFICDATESDCNGTKDHFTEGYKHRFDTGQPANPWGRLAPGHLQIYYRNNGSSVLESFPTGLKMIAGPVFRSGFSRDAAGDTKYEDVDQVKFHCESSQLYLNQPGSSNKMPHCGAAQIFEIDFPVCWDGVRLDSTKDLFDNPLPAATTNQDTGQGYPHRDHMRYAVSGNCSNSYTKPEKQRIAELQGLNPSMPDSQLDNLIRSLTRVNFIMRLSRDYVLKDASGNLINKHKEDDHVYWYALGSQKLDTTPGHCTTGDPHTDQPDAGKECWVKGYPECPPPVTPLADADTLCAQRVQPVKVPMDLIDSGHADYFFGWDPLRLDFLTHECLSRKDDCKASSGPTVGFIPAGPNCSDGLDNDGDGKIDWQADGSGDHDCSTPADNTESADGAGRTLHFKATPDHLAPGNIATMTWSEERMPMLTVGCEASGDWEGNRLSTGRTVTSKLDGPPGTVFKFNLVCDPDNLATDPLDDTSGLNQTVTVTLGEAPPDTQAPTVSLTAPANGATVRNTIPVSASASDDVGVVGVQFRLDGDNLSPEDTSAPYTINWDTTKVTDGSHSLSAIARDAAGHSTTSGAVSVIVNNSQPPSCPPDCPPPPPTEQFPVGDLNKDHHVDVLDLSILLTDYGGSDPVSDIDGQNGVDVIDLSLLLSHYGT